MTLKEGTDVLHKKLLNQTDSSKLSKARIESRQFSLL